MEVLLHSCCAPCSAAIIEWMLCNDVRPVIFYYNPNIFPQEEYLIRKNEITRYAEKLGLTIIDGDYNHQQWRDFVTDNVRRCYGLDAATQPERGVRCLECFKLRLLHSAMKCKELGLTVFTTTLASSRWKSLQQITEAGNWAATVINSQSSALNSQAESITFDARNWRKGGLQERRSQLLKENGFYNQLYCGCEFSQSS